jgi:uncharacterized membrane protein HdeD (DUF308 family)
MSLNLNEEQKSPKRRFLLLGIIRLVCVVVVGVLIMFWNKIDLNLSETQKVIIGVLFIVYGVLRFYFSYKNAPDQ